MGQIVTFYSYKGGVGRTFALVNIGVLIAGLGKRVLLMDWDLEAPGMEYFFTKLPNWAGIKADIGVLPLLEACRSDAAIGWKRNVITIPVTDKSSIDFIPSGSHAPDYADRLRQFPWEGFFTTEKRGPVLERMRAEWAEEYDFVLIDSRTGVTEIGGVCTILLPDILAVVFTAAEQSLDGLIGVIESAREERRILKVPRTDLGILPILSRFDGGKETDLAERWLSICARRLKPYFDVWLPQPNDDTIKHFLGATRIPHVPRYTFGEPLVALENTWSPDLAGSYLKIHAELLANSFQNALEIVSFRGSGSIKKQDNRFEVAFSFSGPHREKERAIAECVALKLGRERVFFDEWYEFELAGVDIDVQFSRIYAEQSLMVVAELSAEHTDRQWSAIEARAIRGLRSRLDATLDETARLRLLNIRLGEDAVPKDLGTEAYLDGSEKSAEECAELILKRHALILQRMSAEANPEATRQIPSSSLPRTSHSERDLLPEKSDALEFAWFFAWLRSCSLYLAAFAACVGSVTAVVAAWKKFSAPPGQKADVTVYFIAGILTLPLLFAFLFNLLPALRRRREMSLRPTGVGEAGYFTTAPRKEDAEGLFRTGYESFLDWAADPPAPLLHLTGLSGSGKSSLLAAFLKPRLATPKSGPKSTLLIIRSYTDPLAAMKDALLMFWKHEPDDHGRLGPLDALHRAAARLGKNERLIVAFDQFEEFFLLHTGASQPGGDGAKTRSVPSLPDNFQDADFVPVRDFLQAFLANPPERVSLLLSYRSDHSRLLAPLGLPTRTEGVNHMIVEPLDFADATRFLQSCPGLVVPEDRMQRVLQEAAAQEGGRVVMRPIVANLLGLILRNMSGHPTLWRRTGDLLRGYVKDCLGEELRDERARILTALLTDFHTARPRPATEIAHEAGFNPANFESYLEHLGHAGLLRCINPEEPTPARRVWQIAHDFLATLIERTLEGARRAIWRMVRPWLALAAVGFAVVFAFVWPWWEQQRAIVFITNQGFTWNQNAAVASATKAAGIIERFGPLAAALHTLRPRRLDLSGSSVLRNADGLSDLTTLQSLDLSNSPVLQNIDALKGLTSLKSLDLSNSPALQNIDALKGLTSLQSLNLNNSPELQNIDPLKGMTSLQSLDLSNSPALRNIDALNGLTSLRSLDLSNCASLRNIDALKALTALQNLNLRGCKALSDGSWIELRAALSHTFIVLPDGHKVGPDENN